MVNPKQITKFNRTQEELEYFWIFCILVAGKNSDWACIKLSQMFKHKPLNITPLQFLKEQGHGLRNMLMVNKVGQYNRIVRAIEDSYEVNLKKATAEDLINKVFGVGPKTARFFILHTRKNCEYVILDTHILKWLNKNYKNSNFPSVTPPGGKYLYFESIAARLIKSNFPHISMAEADLLIWLDMSGRLDGDPIKEIVA